MRRVLSAVGAVLQAAVTVLLALLLAGNLYLIGMERLAGAEPPAIFGYSVAVVASGSMEPALSVDDLIVSHRQADYAVGDIITFRSGGSLTTHRVTAVTEAGYGTRGDANNADDPAVTPPEAVVGRVVAVVPGLGRFLAALKTPLGLTSLVLLGCIILGLPALLRREQAGGEEL